MKKIALLFLLSLIVFSCQKNENKKKNWPVASESKVSEQNNDSISQKEDKKDFLIKLPQDRHAIVTLELYTTNDEEYGEEAFYRPIAVKVFDNKTKKEIPEVLLSGIYYSDEVWYGDFNFDGKMDVACDGRNIGYRDFYTKNFYLATKNGYEYHKDFSVITDDPIAYIKLDAKKKTITSYREAEYNESSEYIVKNNKLEEGRYTKDADRHGPFLYHYDSDAVLPERTILSYIDPKNVIISFNTEDLSKNILIFRYDETGFSDVESDSYNLHYAEMINDSLVNSSYSDNFIYDKKNKTLLFEDEMIKYKIYEIENDFGIEITEKGKTSKLTGNPSSKKGGLSRISEIKKGSVYKNVTIQ